MSCSSSSSGTKTGSSRPTAIMSARAPGREHSEVGPAEGLPGATGGELEDGRRVDRPGVALAEPGEHGREPHLLPEIEVVVRGRPVGAESDPDPVGEKVDQRRDPRGELRIGLRAVGDRDVVTSEHRHVLGREPDAVGSEDPPFEHTFSGEDHGDRSPVLGLEGLSLVFGLGEMQVEDRIERTSFAGCIDQHRQRHRVGGVRGEADLEATVPHRGAVGGSRRSRRCGCSHQLAPPSDPGNCRIPGVTIAARTCGEHRVGDRVLEEVRLGRGGHPETEELGQRPASFPSRRPLASGSLPAARARPAANGEGQVLPGPSEQGHRRVAVRVDEARRGGRRGPRSPRPAPTHPNRPRCRAARPEHDRTVDHFDETGAEDRDREPSQGTTASAR